MTRRPTPPREGAPAGADGESSSPWSPSSAPAAVAPSRRQVLAATATLATASLAGCAGIESLGGASGGGDDDEPIARSLPSVEEPPDVVYVPSHREGVEPLGRRRVGPYELQPMVSYAHPFWLVSGESARAVDVADDEDVHLMVAVAHAETGTTLPPSGLSWTIRRDGSVYDERSPWRMLSQRMGLHAGGNVPLGEDGRYEVTLSMPPLGVRTAGALAGRFEDPETATFEFTYDQALRDRLVDRISYVDEDARGVPGAIEPMDAAAGLPPADALPGTLQGVPVSTDQRLPRSHDADVAVTVVEGGLDRGSADAVSGEPYLLASPRTPYNRVPLPGMAMTATVEREGQQLGDHRLVPTVHEDAGFHYGATVPELSPGDELSIAVDSPPGGARHQGYETAFLEMAPIDLSVEGW